MGVRISKKKLRGYGLLSAIAPKRLAHLVGRPLYAIDVPNRLLPRTLHSDVYYDSY